MGKQKALRFPTHITALHYAHGVVHFSQSISSVDIKGSYERDMNVTYRNQPAWNTNCCWFHALIREARYTTNLTIPPPLLLQIQIKLECV